MAMKLPSPRLCGLISTLLLTPIRPVWAADPGALTHDRPTAPLAPPEYRSETLPPTPLALPQAPVAPLPAAPAGQGRFLLKAVRFEGNTAFTTEQLDAVAHPYIGRAVTLSDLEDLRLDLTRYYENAGYVSSGALLPAQHIENGVVTYRLVEGRLSEIQISGADGLNPEYVAERLRLGAEGALNADRLRERFQLLLSDPLIERLNGALRPGLSLGETRLDLAVTRALPYELALVVDNHRPPGTGAEEVRLEGVVRNLTGWGDALELGIDGSEGGWDGDARFGLPLNAQDTRLALRYSGSDSTVVEQPLEVVDIDSGSRDWSLELSHPLIQDLDANLTLGLSFDLRYMETSLMGEGTPFSPGVEPDGEARARVLRFSQDYTRRGARQAVAARSTFSFGIPVLGATHQGNGDPDGTFATWIGQVQYAHKLGEEGAQVILRGDLQLASERLLPMEQFAVGGAESVRGYRENQLVRDIGYRLSAEYRRPLRAEFLARSDQQLEWLAFVDAGGAAYKGETSGVENLRSAGVGLRWRWRGLSAQLDWAHGFEPVPESGDRDLQDDGLHFQLRWDVY